MRKLNTFLADESGVSATEFGLILALIAAAIIGSLAFLVAHPSGGGENSASMLGPEGWNA